MMIFASLRKKPALPTSAEALPGRDQPIATARDHFVNGAALKGPYPARHECAMFGMGCFWGAEKAFWTRPGVLVTAAGYAGGQTTNPTYHEVCTGMTGHNEVVFVVFDPRKISYEALLKIFWEGHDPTQGMRQGNDAGTQYRSGIYVYSDAQRQAASLSLGAYQEALDDHRGGSITTEIVAAPPFYFAEADHQQYLAKNPSGYCGLGGTGVGYCAPQESTVK